MRRQVLDLIRSFGRLETAVIGEAMLDSYLRGGATRLCREAPVPVVDVEERSDEPGGAANTAMNLAALGAQVSMLGVVGADDDGRRLRRALEAGGVDHSDLLSGKGRRTLAKTRIVGSGQMLLRVDQGSTEELDTEVEGLLIDRLVDLHGRVDVLVVSDYGYGTLTARILEVLEQLQRRRPVPLIVDAKYPERYRRLRVAAVKPNYGEVVRLLGLEPRSQDRIAQVEPFEQQLLDVTGARIVAATLDCEGALVFERDAHPFRTYARPVPNSQATGAGDTFTAALALTLAAGGDAPTAAECASAAARLVVARGGTSTCTQGDLLAALAADDKVIADREELASLLRHLRAGGNRIVFTNGCFDILHRGHVTYLSRAKSLGDILVVGVNGDAQVRAQKGPGRPINGLEDRLGVLSALSCVDYLVPFDEPTPRELLLMVRPDVFVKGGDYSEETLPEAPLVRELGGEVELLPYLDGRSTTGIIERARNGSAPHPAGSTGTGGS